GPDRRERAARPACRRRRCPGDRDGWSGMKRGLALVGVRAGYGPVEALHGVTMAFPAGCVVAILGRNGAGKSTALRVLAGSIPARTGAVRWDGRDVTSWNPYERALAGFTLVPDEQGVFASLTVAENLALFAGSQPVDAVLAVFPELE